MARKIISEVCEAIRIGGISNDLDEVCRYVVAQEMEHEDRILDDDEIDDIVEDIVEQEDIVDPADTVDEDGIANITDTEWENIDDEIKVIDPDGDDAIVVEGHVYKVRISKDIKAKHIAEGIRRDIEGAWNLINMNSGANADIESYHRTGSIDTVCPECGSTNQTPVWYDDDEQYVYCNDCGADYQVEVDPAEETVEERTVEDVQLVDEEGLSIVGTMFYDSELGWTWQIWENGEVIEQDVVDEPDGAYSAFAAFMEQYDGITEDEVLNDTETGESEQVLAVNIARVITTKRRYSRARLALKLMAGRKVADDSEVYRDVVNDGDVFEDDFGNEVEVIDADDDILYIENKMDERTSAYRTQYMTLPYNSFMRMIDEKGYRLV